MAKVVNEISCAVLIPPEVSDGATETSLVEPKTFSVEPELSPVPPAPVVKEAKPSKEGRASTKERKRPPKEPETDANDLLQGDIELNGLIINPVIFQKLEEKAQKAQEALEKEEKLRKDLEALNSKLLAEKTALLDSLSGEKGCLQDYQEKCAKLTAQKNDLDNQLRVSWESIRHIADQATKNIASAVY